MPRPKELDEIMSMMPVEGLEALALIGRIWPRMDECSKGSLRCLILKLMDGWVAYSDKLTVAQKQEWKENVATELMTRAIGLAEMYSIDVASLPPSAETERRRPVPATPVSRSGSAYPVLPEGVEVGHNDQPPQLGTWMPPPVYGPLPVDSMHAPAGGADDSPALDPILCWTQYLREQDRQLDNLCKGLIAIASPPTWPSEWATTE